MSVADNGTMNPTRVLGGGLAPRSWPEPNTSSSPQSVPQAIRQRGADMSVVLQQVMPSPNHPCGTVSDRLTVVPASVWRLAASRPVAVITCSFPLNLSWLQPFPLAFANTRRSGLYAIRRLKRIECPSVGPHSLGNATRHVTSRTNSLKSHPH